MASMLEVWRYGKVMTDFVNIYKIATSQQKKKENKKHNEHKIINNKSVAEKQNYR